MRRRTFLAGAGALLVGGCGSSSGRAVGGRRVIVVGAGLAGLGAAAQLRAAGIEPVVLEARDRIGGRVHTVDDLGVPVDLGAAWIHDSRGNPLTDVARRARLATRATDYEAIALRRRDGTTVGAAALEAALGAGEEIEEALARRAQEAGAGDRLAPALARARRAAGLRGDAAGALDWLLGNALGLDLGADARELSVLGFDEGETYEGGDDLLLRGGASGLVRAIARGADVRTATPVAAVRRTSGGVTVTTRAGERLRADGCVVTVPLGVLQAGDVRFDPPLPAAARRAVARLGMGLLDKVLLRYDARWWPEADTLGVIGAPIARTHSAFDLSGLTGAPVLVVFTGASDARALERRGDAEIVGAVTAELAAAFGRAAGRPAQALVTRWAADPFARGSYSYLRPGATTADRVALGTPAGRVVLAGEHTSPDRPQTMDGAWRAGRRAARLLASRLA